MTARLLFLCAILLAVPASAADVREWVHAGCGRKGVHLAELARRDAAVAPLDRATRPLDVQHVDLWISIPDALDHIDARVTSRVVVLEPTAEIVLDFENETTQSKGLRVSGVWVENQPTTFEHSAGDTLAIALPALLAAGDTTTVRVEYGGVPLPGRSPGFGLRFTNFIDGEFQPDPEWPVVQTLSQPVGARTWWPCHDHPADAATVRLTVEMPAGFQLAAPGLRESIRTLPGGRIEQTNHMPTPIPSYLVSLIVAEYERWSEPIDVTELSPDGNVVPRTIDLVYYAPAFRRADAEYTWQNTATMMQRFETLWGPYPYADIKYGNAVFNGAVAMEHPTMSSIGDSPFTLSDRESTLYPGPVGELVNAHELAHMWFGNAVRLERWGDIWLNEGFARYAEVLWLEEFYGSATAKAYLDLLAEGRPFWSGTLRNPPPTALFSGVTYDRGAWTLHMLRQVLGRDGLMTAMRDYVTDPALRFGAVTVEDFQAHCEAVAGEPLGWFFEPWLTLEPLPRLTVSWVLEGTDVLLSVRQPADAAYELRLPVRMVLADGSTRDVVARVAGADARVRLDAGGVVRRIEIDPDANWLLDVTVEGNQPVRVPVAIDSVYPNPFNPNTAIVYSVGQEGPVRIDLFDVRGRHVRRLLDDVRTVGRYEEPWDGLDDAGRSMGSGVYLVRVGAGGKTASAKLALVR